MMFLATPLEAAIMIATLIGAIFLLKFSCAKNQRVVMPAPVAAPVAEPAAVVAAAAPGSAGRLKLNNVPPKTAAMLMAIVADKMGKPINELRFISIKEVK